MPTPNANTIWADGPSGNPTEPDKALIRQWGTEIENGQAAILPAITDPAFGAASPAASAATNSAAINAAIAYCATNNFQQLWVPPGTFQCNDAIVNEYGVEMIGPGIIVVPPTGEKLNRRVADKKGVFNFKAIWYAASQITTTGKVHILIHGDSTAVDNAPYSPFPYTPSNLLKKSLWNKGIPAVLVSNFAVSGTGLQDLDFTNPSDGTPWFYDPDDPGTFPPNGKVDIVVLKYGINDGLLLHRDSAAYNTLLRARLQTLRDQFGYLMSIIIMSANVITDTYGTDDSDHGRDERWVEEILGIERSAALDFGCVHIDNFSAFKARDGDDGFWMEDLGVTYGAPYRVGTAVHPRSYYNGWMWGGPICDVIADEGMMSAIRYNAYRWLSESQIDYRPLMASIPSDFFHQGMEGTDTLLTDDWGFVGAQRTEFPPNGIARQVAWQAGTNPLGRIRHGSGSAWGKWWIEGALESTGFTALNAKVSLSTAKAIRTGRTGYMEGLFNIATGSFARLDEFATIPDGFRPRTSAMVLISVGGLGYFPGRITTDGKILCEGALTLASASYGQVVGTWVIDS